MGIIFTICVLMVFMLALYPSANTDKHDKLPNIVLILVDDMGCECIGSYGCTEYKTPYIDRLSESGIKFEHCYSQPLSTPSRVKLMTGKYNFRNYEDFGFLNPNEKTFANLLKDAGYNTCIAGKWQLNGLNSLGVDNQNLLRPNQFGFDEYCLWQLRYKGSEGERYANPLITQNGHDLQVEEYDYGPDIFSNYIIDFIGRKAGEPFFVYYPMVLVHSPFVSTPDSPQWKDTSAHYVSDTANFAGMVNYMDKIVGKIAEKLKKEEVWENTMFIFTSDNGTGREIITSTLKGKIKGGKGMTLNTGNHVPLIVTWPKVIKQKDSYSGIIDFSDFFPTLADAAGIHPSSYNCDGDSFYKVLIGREKTHHKEEIFIHYSPRWNGLPHNRWVMNNEYKLYQDGRFYNTYDDPEEKKPLENLTKSEAFLKRKFEAIIQTKETEFPFSWNNLQFNPRNR